MKTIKSGQRKAKINPTGICLICGIKIFNKLRNAKYCINCMLVKDWTARRTYNIVYDTKRYYPNYQIKINYKVVKKC